MENTEHEAFAMAREMLATEHLNSELVARIGRVIELVETVSGFDGGSLRSRQAVAIIVEQWEQDNK